MGREFSGSYNWNLNFPPRLNNTMNKYSPLAPGVMCPEAPVDLVEFWFSLRSQRLCGKQVPHTPVNYYLKIRKATS